MIYKFRIVSDEVDNFKREIAIDADDTFLRLRNAILDSVGYTKDQMDSFFICDEGLSWHGNIVGAAGAQGQSGLQVFVRALLCGVADVGVSASEGHGDGGRFGAGCVHRVAGEQIPIQVGGGNQIFSLLLHSLLCQ